MTEVPSLTVGAILGDSDVDSMVWSRAIGALSMRVQDLREGVYAPVRLSVAYHVDVRLARNEFEGVRTGRFDKRASRLVVQAAVSGAVEDKPALLMRLLDDAVDEAERYLQKKGLATALPEIRSILERLAR